ncbi:MAG TPA: RNA methyltransferase [Anaeromyxobacter sp.]|nr:RNA methyltransferase [Anaeromyxobacter sp.]
MGDRTGRTARAPRRPRASGATGERIFCACAPGLEELLRDELADLGLSARTLPGGAEAEGTEAAALACLASRLSDAVLLRLWEGPGAELGAAKRAAARQAGGLPLLVRVAGDAATISVDAAGAPLFRRGWRARVGAAPLRETLAAGLLRAGGWRGDRPFCDPMCGSGTIAIEAALSAARRAPGLDRPLALEALPGRGARVARLREALRAGERGVPVPVVASDRNAGALRLARKNAAAAGVEGAIRFERCDAAQAPLPAGGPGLCAVNPPYGLRLEEGAAEAWRALGALTARLAGWDLLALGPDRGLERLLPLRPAATWPVQNGGLTCRIYCYTQLP